MIHGKNRIGKELSNKGVSTYVTYDPATNKALEGTFYAATNQEVNEAMTKAQSAFEVYRYMKAEQRASFLEAIADEMLLLDETLVNRASQETGLPGARIINERGRTMMQLRLFADLIREGSWVEASIDSGDPGREPLPKPDLRKMSQPLGPVVVFTASNFPLAYSTVGGDTASALAAGCPVVVKSHPSHAGTNELVADCVARAAKKTGMPDGVFSSLNSNSYEVGLQLVKHPITAAVGFTGSFQGGTALWKAANDRDVPIPVFSEMGSTNPVYFFDGILKTQAKALAATMSASITLGAGQFCTNPGLMVGIKSKAMDAFIHALNIAVSAAPASVMLSESIAGNYNNKLKSALEQKGVNLISAVQHGTASENDGLPHVATVDFKIFKENPRLHEEVFGPFSLLVLCKNEREMAEFAKLQHGQLTTSVFGTDDDFKSQYKLVQYLTNKAGRLIFNGVPTGVEVNGSQHHGGPFPATTDSRFTSVGPDAIKRFVRPVAYQNAPEFMLPEELKNGNPLGIWRRVDGELTKD